MAGLLESLSLRWTVTIPTRPLWPNSKSFHLGDEEFYLNCSANRRGIIFLNLMCPDSTPFDSSLIPLYCTVSVESTGAGRVLSTQSIRVDDRLPDWTNRLDSYTINIWQQHTNGIEEVDFDFCDTRELTFTITWGTTPLHISPFFDQIRQGTREITGTSNPFPESSSKSFSSRSSTTEVSVQTYSCTNQSLDSLLEDLAKLLAGDSNKDVELHCEGHITKAHKAVLSVRSPVLETMLQTDMVEGRTGVVKIKDMTADTFNSFIRYLYTGKLDALTFDSAVRLYEAGDMYRVQSLARGCSRYLIDNLTVENSCHILVVADAHSDSSFVDKVIAYMVEAKIPTSGDNWKAFCDTHSKLANQVLSSMCEKLSN